MTKKNCLNVETLENVSAGKATYYRPPCKRHPRPIYPIRYKMGTTDLEDSTNSYIW